MQLPTGTGGIGKIQIRRQDSQQIGRLKNTKEEIVKYRFKNNIVYATKSAYKWWVVQHGTILYNSEIVKNTHGEVLILVSNTPPWVFINSTKLHVSRLKIDEWIVSCPLDQTFPNAKYSVTSRKNLGITFSPGVCTTFLNTVDFL